MLKINQSAFIRNLVKEENLSYCNATKIPMKARSFLDMLEKDDYKETNLKTY